MRRKIQVLVPLLLLLPACGGPGSGDCPAGEDCKGTISTPTGSTDDSGPDDSGPDDSGPDDSGTLPDPCLSPVAIFEPESGEPVDVTADLLDGTYLTLDTPGRLAVCPGTWFARVLIRSQVEVVGLGATPADTVLSGGESGSVMDVAGIDSALTVSNVTLDRGLGLSTEHNSGGGGIYCEGYTLEDAPDVFLVNHVTATDVVFSNHEANDGPAIYVEDCEVSITRSEFVDNFAEDDGGAVTIWYSHITITDSSFARNEGLDGGAFALFYGTATISGTTFEGNRSGNFAGGVWIYSSVLTMTDSVLKDNVNSGANGDGGGMLLYSNPDTTSSLQRVSFEGNSAVKGGGLFVYYESVLDADSCDFSGNTAEDIYVADYSAAGGVSYTAGAGYSFSCAENVCTER